MHRHRILELNRIRQGVHFLSLELEKADLHQNKRIDKLIKNWAAVLGKEARRVNRERLEDLSEQPVSFGDVDQLVGCKELAQLFCKLVEEAKRGKPLDPHSLHTVTIWLAGCLLLTNTHRPGAICNIKMEEVRKAKSSTEGRTPFTQIRVYRHNTGTTGSAHLTAYGVLHHRLQQFVEHLRPLLAESPLLFPNRAGRPLDHLSRQVQQLGKSYELNLPTVTEGRHAAATAAALRCTPDKRTAIAKQMSHSVQTQERFYDRTKSQAQAFKGFKLLQELRGTGRGDQRGPVGFTKEEVETISLYFEGHISSGDIPSAGECKHFLSDHPMERTHK